MVEKDLDDQKSKDLHRSNTFSGGAKAFAVTGLFAVLGGFGGRWLGQLGEMQERGYKGLSTLLGTIVGAVSMGALAGYVALRKAAEDEARRDAQVSQKECSAASAPHVDAPAAKVETKTVDAQGIVQAPVLERAV